MFLWNWAANGPSVHPQDETWVDMYQLWNDIHRKNKTKQKTWRETFHSATLSIRNPTWTAFCVNLGLYSGKVATNHLSYGMAK
jgi:hypothetical protein